MAVHDTVKLVVSAHDAVGYVLADLQKSALCEHSFSFNYSQANCHFRKNKIEFEFNSNLNSHSHFEI